MYTLKNLIRGDVIDVIYSAQTNRVFLVTDPAYAPGEPRYMVPLICPVCGEPWHFVLGDKTPDELVAELKKSLEGFQLVEARYISQSSSANIAATMEKFSAGSTPADLLLEISLDHQDEDGIFPIVSLSFEKRVPSSLPSPDELRAMSPKKVRELLDLDKSDEIEEAIIELEEWMADDDYEDYEVEDDFLLAVHPTSILDGMIVEALLTPLEDRPAIYPKYQAIIHEVENPDEEDDEDFEDDEFEDNEV